MYTRDPFIYYFFLICVVLLLGISLGFAKLFVGVAAFIIIAIVGTDLWDNALEEKK